MASSVVTPLPTEAGDLPQGRPSSWRGVAWGATLGLAIVAAFVAGTRMASRAHAASATPPAATTAPGPVQSPITPVTTPPSPVVVAPPSPQPAPAPTTAAAAMPSIDADSLPLAKRPRAAVKVASRVIEPKAQPSAAPVASVAPPAASAQASDPPPADSAPSLVPVIPDAPKPAVDPFVRAVQQDIQESEGH